MARTRLLPVFALAVPALLTACPGGGDGEGEGALVVGLQTAQDITGLVGAVHVVTKVDGVVTADEVVPSASLPKEIELHGAPGARAVVTAEALPSGAPAGAAPIITRLAAASLVPGEKKLLRINLESRCLTLAGGGPIAPVCAAPETCLSGRCASSDVPYDGLEDYEPSWASAPPDMCRPANHGPPEVVIGTGQTDYATLAPEQELMLEKGPQGGHHIWIALRMKNLRQSGSTTTISSVLEGDPTPVPPVAYVFTFDRDEGAYCKLFGLRYQLDSGATDLGNAYKRFLGKRLTVTVTVADSTGAKASATQTVRIADKLLCPDGTDACNTPR